MKSNLNCLATDCIYNEGGYCYASYINLNGLDATNTYETNCETFSKSRGALTSIEKQLITTSQNISCSAQNCTYNLLGSCSCNHVVINRDSTGCENFRLKH